MDLPLIAADGLVHGADVAATLVAGAAAEIFATLHGEANAALDRTVRRFA